MKINKLEKSITLLCMIVIIVASIYFNNQKENISDTQISYEIANIPEYSGEICVTINNNIPEFSEEDINIKEDYYSILENKRVRNGYGKN